MLFSSSPVHLSYSSPALHTKPSLPQSRSVRRFPIILQSICRHGFILGLSSLNVSFAATCASQVGEYASRSSSARAAQEQKSRRGEEAKRGGWSLSYLDSGI